MDYTYIPEALLYKRKSLDKLVMQHPLNAIVIKRLMKMDSWNKHLSRDNVILTCLNNAYYICTMMRLEYDATFRERSYQGIARQGFVEGNNTLAECITLSLVALMIEHSTTGWHQKLQEVANDLRHYAKGLIDEREGSVLGLPDVQLTNVVHLIGIPDYLSNGIDDSLVLPDDFFQPRAIDNKAITALYMQDPTFNWDKKLYRDDEDAIHEIIESLGKTQFEKAILIRSIWKDTYYSRKSLGLPIKDSWLILKTQAQEFCPDCIELTELHKIPDSGIEFERRISELEEEVNKMEKENVELKSQLAQKAVTTTSEAIDKKKWIGCFDGFLDTRLNAETIAEKLHEINSPHLPKDERGFWWVVFTVFSEIHWIPSPSKNQKTILQWANLHFDCGWDWRKDNQFKFSDISDKIKKKKSSEWNKNLTGNVIGDYYGELACEIRKSFVEIIDGKIFDRSRFISPGCQRINNGR